MTMIELSEEPKLYTIGTLRFSAFSLRGGYWLTGALSASGGIPEIVYIGARGQEELPIPGSVFINGRDYSRLYRGEGFGPRPSDGPSPQEGGLEGYFAVESKLRGE